MFIIQRDDRTIEKINDLVEEAKKLGIEPTVGNFEAKMTMRQQWETVLDYDIFLGRHGAGMSWGHFLPPHGVFVELFAHSKQTAITAKDPSYWIFKNIAYATGHAYVEWTSYTVGGDSKKRYRGFKYQNFVIDEARMRHALIQARDAALHLAGCPVEMPVGVLHWKFGRRNDILWNKDTVLTGNGLPDQNIKRQLRETPREHEASSHTAANFPVSAVCMLVLLLAFYLGRRLNRKRPSWSLVDRRMKPEAAVELESEEHG